MTLSIINSSTIHRCGELKTGPCNDTETLDLEQNIIGIDDEEIELQILLGSLVLLLSIGMTIIFNGTLLYCLMKNRKKQWVRNAQQIFYLILSDFIVGILLLPRSALIFMRSTGLSYRTCATFSYILATTQSVSFYHIMAVCIHRCRMAIQILSPVGVNRYNYGRESLFIWLGVLFVYIPPYIFWGRQGELIFKCLMGYLFGPSDTGAKLYMLVLYIIPWITTNVLYIFVLFKVKRSLKRVHAVNTDLNVSTNSDSSTPQTTHVDKKILRTIGLLLLAFNASIIVCMASVIGTLFGKVIPRVFQALLLINNVCNPLIYLSASSTLRKETYGLMSKLGSILQCKK